MRHQKPQNQEYLGKLDDILARYEISLPITTAELLGALQSLDNPYDLMEFFDTMHGLIAQEFGEALAANVMPEISAVHSRLPRPALGGLTFSELETTLRNAQNSPQKMPKTSSTTCQAVADLASILQYIQQNQPLLTKKLRQINRKSISEINALLVEPQQAIHDYGKAVFTDRDEHEFWKIRFLRTIAQAEHMTYIRNNKLHISKRGAGWLQLDEATKIESLFRGWCEVTDWAFWNYYYEAIAKTLHFEQLMLYQAILALHDKYTIISEKSLDDICATLCGIDNTLDEYGRYPISYIPYSIVTRPLVYFGVAKHTHEQNERGIMVKKDFTLTKLGEWMLKKAICHNWSWTKADKICPDCQKIHR